MAVDELDLEVGMARLGQIMPGGERKEFAWRGEETVQEIGDLLCMLPLSVCKLGVTPARLRTLHCWLLHGQVCSNTTSSGGPSLATPSKPAPSQARTLP